MRLLRLALLSAAVLGAACALVGAAPDEDVYIYKGAPLAQEGITAGGWGGGKAAESKEKILTGGQSIKIITQGLYAGARLDFAQPPALFTSGIDKTRYIVFTFMFEDTQTVDPAGGTNYWFDVEPYIIPRASKVRFVFVSDAGLKVSTEEPTNPVDPDDGWVRIAVPLAKLKVPEGTTEFRLKRLLIFTDIATLATQPMYLGEIKLITDAKPIKVDSLGAQTVAIYDPVFFVANTDGGVSSLKYSWDYNAANGIQPESAGKMGQYIYTIGGEFTVTLTVSDVDGVKPSVSATGTIEVID